MSRSKVRSIAEESINDITRLRALTERFLRAVYPVLHNAIIRSAENHFILAITFSNVSLCLTHFLLKNYSTLLRSATFWHLAHLY